MCTLVETVRDAELTLLEKLGKAKGGPLPFDPKKPAVRVYGATRFPEWQDVCLQAVKAAWVPETVRVDDAKVRSHKQNHHLLPMCFFFSTRAHTETYCGVWSQVGVPA